MRLMKAAIAGVVVSACATSAALAGIVPGSTTVDYVVTHDSGFVDENNQAIKRTLLDPGHLAGPPVMTEGGTIGVPPQIMPTGTLFAGDSGQSTAAGAVWMHARAVSPVAPYSQLRPLLNGRSEISQYNPNDTAVGPARLRMEFSGGGDFEYVETSLPYNTIDLPAVIFMQGQIGSGEGAYIQYEMDIQVRLFNADGEEVAPLQDEIPGPSTARWIRDGRMTFGGDELITEGGGRITREHVPSGELERIPVGNFGPYATFLGGTYIPGPPPRIPVGSDVVSFTYEGFIELSAKNDGSPSGIVALDESAVPEPGAIAILLTALPLLARRRRD